jgi:glyoxylase-like metal-dependent hydrolase (beta-lactamase superfamily II)
MQGRITKACVFAMFGIHAVQAPAAAPMAKAQPGFFRMSLGDFEITALNDGVVAYPVTRLLPTATAAQIKGGLVENGLTDPVGLSYNAFLVNTGSKLVLIDTGTGGKLDHEPEFHGAGRLMNNLRASGYRPEQIDEVLITHQGQDHIGGLTLGEERAFPNARVRVPKSETDMLIFLDPAGTAALLERAHGDERVKAWLQFTRDLFEPYIKAGKFQTFDGDVTLEPGIRALATHGHTLGHTSFVVQSQGHTLIVMGDLVLMGALQFANPSLGSAFDANQKLAAEQRRRIFEMAVANDYWVAGGHLSFPGIGHVRAERTRYYWAPANYGIP